MPTEFVGQDGAKINQNTKIAVSGCPKSKHVKHRRPRNAAKEQRRSGRSMGIAVAGCPKVGHNACRTGGGIEVRVVAHVLGY